MRTPNKPQYMSAPSELRVQGIDFLSRLVTSADSVGAALSDSTAAQRSDDDGSLNPAFSGDEAEEQKGAPYGVLMFRRPTRAELDQGYSADDYFLTAPTSVESPFSHSAPSERGLMTQSSPRAAIRTVEEGMDQVLYGDLNSLLDGVSAGVGKVASALSPVGSHLKQSWQGLSDENKAMVAGIGAVGGGALAARGFRRFANTKRGQTLIMARALRRSGGSTDIENDIVAGEYGSPDDPSGWNNLADAYLANQGAAITSGALLNSAQPISSDRTAVEEAPVVEVPVDFFRTAYQLGLAYQQAAADPAFAYPYLSGEPTVTMMALKSLRAVPCYLDYDGGLHRTATPYAAPFFAGGALWDKIKSGIKKIGGKLIDFGAKVANSTLGKMALSIIPGGGMIGMAASAAGKIKDKLAGVTGGGSDSSGGSSGGGLLSRIVGGIKKLFGKKEQPADTSQGAEPSQVADASQANASAAQAASSAPAEAPVSIDDQLAAQRAQDQAAAAAAMSQSLAPIDEMVGSSYDDAKLPSSWRSAPAEGALGDTLQERVNAMVGSTQMGGDPMAGVVFLAPLIPVLLKGVAAGAAWAVGERGVNRLVSYVKAKRESKDMVVSGAEDAGAFPASMELFQQQLTTLAAQDPTPGSPLAGSAITAVAKKVLPAAGALVRKSWAGLQRAGSKVGTGAKSVFTKATSVGGKRVISNIARKSAVAVRWLARNHRAAAIGSLGAFVVGSTLVNRKRDQRAEIFGNLTEIQDVLKESGYETVANDNLQWLTAHKDVIVESPQDLSEADIARLASIAQISYVAVRSMPDACWPENLLRFAVRLEKAGESAKEADPAAANTLEDMLAAAIGAVLQVDPADQAAFNASGDAQAWTAADDDALAKGKDPGPAQDVAALLASMGLPTGDVTNSPSPDGGEPSSGEAEPAADGDVDVAERPAAYVTPEQQDAVEQATAMLASVPVDEDDSRERASAINLLLNAGLGAGAAASIIALIDKKRDSHASRNVGEPATSPWHAFTAYGGANPSSRSLSILV